MTFPNTRRVPRPDRFIADTVTLLLRSEDDAAPLLWGPVARRQCMSGPFPVCIEDGTGARMWAGGPDPVWPVKYERTGTAADVARAGGRSDYEFFQALSETRRRFTRCDLARDHFGEWTPSKLLAAYEDGRTSGRFKQKTVVPIGRGPTGLTVTVGGRASPVSLRVYDREIVQGDGLDSVDRSEADDAERVYASRFELQTRAAVARQAGEALVAAASEQDAEGFVVALSRTHGELLYGYLKVHARPVDRRNGHQRRSPISDEWVEFTRPAWSAELPPIQSEPPSTLVTRAAHIADFARIYAIIERLRPDQRAELRALGEARLRPTDRALLSNQELRDAFDQLLGSRLEVARRRLSNQGSNHRHLPADSASQGSEEALEAAR